MKKTLLPLLLLFFISIIVHGQEDKSPIVKYLVKRGYKFPDSTSVKRPDSLKKWPDTLYYNTVYKAKLLRSPTIPITFNGLEYSNGSFQVEPTISIGFGYTWFLGDFIFNEDDKIAVDPTFYFGAVGCIGLQNNFSLQKLANFFTGGFVGFGAFSLYIGYDFVALAPSISIGGRIDLYTIDQKFLKPIGKIRSLRKHKRVVQPIYNE